MHKLLASAYKEFLLLTRDLGGLAILFVMPLVLIITITIIQEGTFKSLNNTKIPILVVDYDSGKISKNIIEGLTNAATFDVYIQDDELEAKEMVFKGDYQLAIIIPKNLSVELAQKVAQNVNHILNEFGVEEEIVESTKASITKKEIILYFDPATQIAFKSSVKNGIDKMISKIETQSIYKAFQEQITDDPTQAVFDTESFITFKEILPRKKDEEIHPNSVQHNVPAWSLFAIFFIIVPLSINMVKEKTQGTFVRLRTHPVSYATVLGGKTLVYVGVCIIQFVLMLLIGVFVFPAIGLPTLEVSGRLPYLFVVAFFAGLAAVGLGLLLGTVAKTQEQSAPFGATFVVVLAALGGVWVPVFVMPKMMQVLSNISPINWGLNAFYDIFLRQGNLKDILQEISLLFLFFLITTFVAIIYNEKKNTL